MLNKLDNAWPNPHRSVDDFFMLNNLTHPRGDWRLTEYELGMVVGLPKSYGRVVATNGIMCFIQTAPDVLYYGHFTAWQADESDKPISKVNNNFTPKAKKLPVCFQGL